MQRDDERTPGVAESLDDMRRMVASIGTPRPLSAELRSLAKAAVASADARRDEDIGEWARRLAGDVAGAND